MADDLSPLIPTKDNNGSNNHGRVVPNEGKTKTKRAKPKTPKRGNEPASPFLPKPKEVAEQMEKEIREELMEDGSTLREEEKELDSARHSEISEGSKPIKVESIVLMQKPTAKHRSKRSTASDVITIVISELSLEEDSPPMQNDDVKQLYVEYRFFDVEPSETETPFSLPKPKPYHSIAFNFSKTIPIDMEHHYDRRRYLASMLLPNSPEHGRLKFTVVSEPPESTELDCEDVGVAYVDLPKMLMAGVDLKDGNIDVFDSKDETKVIGQMMLTVECVQVLKAVESEMQVDGTY